MTVTAKPREERQERATRRAPARHGICFRVLGRTAAALASAAIVGGAALYLVAPTSVAFAMSVQVYRLAPAKHTKVQAHHEILYGRVLGVGGRPLAGASVLVLEQVGKKRRVVGRIHTDRNGTYRRSVVLPRRRYELEFTARISGHNVTRERVIVLVPGHAYDVSARATERRVFTVLPVGSY